MHNTPYTRSLKSRLLLLLAASGLFVNTAYAHVKWFVDANMPTPPDYQPYGFGDIEVLSWIAFAVFLIAASIYLDGKLPTIRVAKSPFRHDVMEILRIFTGMSLMLTAYEGNLVAPHLSAYGWFGVTMLFLQAIIGILFIANRFMLHASLLMFILFLGVLIQHGIVSVIEYISLIGIALFFIFNNLPTEALTAKYKPYSVDVLRIFTGIALATLGITEKLSGAVLGQAFLAEHQWNFMPLLGLDFFTDRLFVLSAGVMEVVFGTILILGTTTRLNTLVLSLFLMASNMVFLIIGDKSAALMELIGHMPIIGAALVLLLLGYGQKLKITYLWQKPHRVQQ